MDKKLNIDWRVSKKLLPGSLVILSDNFFETIFIGILKNSNSKLRNDTHRQYGYISLNIEILSSAENIDSYHELYMGYQSSSFMMIESAAYFESY